MEKDMAKVLVPSYYKDFHCIGPDCEYTCCGGWRIDVDKATYRKYMACKDPALKRKLETHIKRTGSGYTYARFELEQGTANCPFLSEEKLCEIQLILGEDALCTTCRTYPRTGFSLGDQYQQSLMLSCPETVRQALKSGQPIDFTLVEMNQKDLDAFPKLNFKDELNEKIYKANMSFMISILQNRQYSFEDRMVLLGMYIQRYMNDPKNSPTAIRRFEELLENPGVQEQLDSMARLNKAHFTVMSNIIAQMQSKLSGLFINLLLEALSGMGWLGDATMAEQAERYMDTLEKSQGLLKEWDIYFEHVFVIYIFEHAYLLKPEDIWDFYMKMCVTYFIFRFLLLGIHNQRGKLEEQDMVYLLSQFRRLPFAIQLNELNFVIDYMKEASFSNLAHMTLIVHS